jgi:hypothetical protein
MANIPRNLLSILLLCATTRLFAQTCVHKDLSEKINLTVQTKKIKKGESMDSSVVTVRITDKNAKPIQTIRYGSNFLNEDFTNCRLVRSYTTARNKNSEVVDYNFGNLVVADLNFDGKEDIALEQDAGGNGGPVYNFYIQQSDGQFALDHFLTDSVGSFPKYIDKQKRTLTTVIPANVRYEAKKVFRLDPQSRRWRLISWTNVP